MLPSSDGVDLDRMATRATASEDADRLMSCLKRGRRSLPASSPQQHRRMQALKHYPPPSSDEQEHEAEHKRMEIEPGIFYGSPLGKPSKRPPQLLRLLYELHGDLHSDGSSTQQQAVWATFARQEQAAEFSASQHVRDLALFTYQDHLTGQRRFLASTYLELWNRYQQMQSQLRHHYEIIREKAPCHLYFDLEFKRPANESSNGESMVDQLLEMVGSTLVDTYNLPYTSSWVLELDSSTPEKFSRHLIIRIPETAFKNNSHAGAFVAEVCARIHTRRADNKELDQLFVMDGDSRSRLFVDQGVYSRNRSFRLVFSAKAGKTAVLLPTYRFGLMDDFSIFMRSLICNVDADCKHMLTFGEECAGHGRKQSFKVSAISPRSAGAATSPFGAVDAFVESISYAGNAPGKIRNWYWFAELGVIVYNISGNRFCERIGRQHKSNNIMYIVDLRRAGYYQKCHDPDCRGYKSPLRPIPPTALSVPAPQVQDDEEDAWWQEVAASMDAQDLKCSQSGSDSL